MTDIDYEDYKLLIFKRAHHWHNITGTDVEELTSEGNRAFAEALITFDPKRANFCTHLEWKIKHYVGYFAKYQNARSSPISICVMDTAIFSKGSTNNTAREIEFNSEIQNLSPNAKFVVDLILYPTDTFTNFVLSTCNGKKKITKKKINNYLKTHHPDINGRVVLQEIKNCLFS